MPQHQLRALIFALLAGAALSPACAEAPTDTAAPAGHIERALAGDPDDPIPSARPRGPFGPSLAGADLYYYWDGSTTDNWPTHDPCGANLPNHAAAATPRGAVWLRAAGR